ncbi:conserved hypothetical protein [Coccidioides posadasii str. Silveira]|uniref:Uncharacterized protein n=1 Tax=Coccidioides posadasii (strain RMSCC 757 / Silveira) TaxID=443226 RepID=E9DAD5_COCPS|nr:conserved hypothetical protein [Coccidioides posadasii str. Silveira]
MYCSQGGSFPEQPSSATKFDPPLPRDLNSSNLERLRQVFQKKKKRCRRLDADNHVPAIISQQNLKEALDRAKVQPHDLKTNLPEKYPMLHFHNSELRGLHGRHRVQVVSELLPPVDRWWTVDLYLDDVGEELRISLLEEYANQRNPTNGEIYRKIRQYEEEQNEPFQQRWLARLLRCNRERLEQLDNRRNRRLRQGFNALLAISGLWGREMRISMIHRLVEILNYLESVKEFWSSLVDHHPIAMKRIDQDTVEKLQLMARRASRVDAQAAYGFILSGQAFAGFSETERRTIWTRMERFGGLVPSLHTFFEDCKYLESCAQCIKRLFSPPDESIWKSITPMLVTSPETEEDCLVQTSESTFRQTRMAGMERLDIAYRQVWLYAMRHYPSMPADPKNNDDLLAKPNRAKADECVVYQMAALAHRLGFRSTEITELMNQSPDRQIARPALLKARKPGRFRYNPQVFETLVDRIVDCFSTADPDEPRTTPSSQNTYTQTAVSTPPSTQSTANGVRC